MDKEQAITEETIQKFLLEKYSHILTLTDEEKLRYSNFGAKMKESFEDNNNYFAVRQTIASFVLQDIPRFSKSFIPVIPLPPPEEMKIKRVMDSCAFKAVISTVAGFAMGTVFGLFTASIDPMSEMFPNKTPTTRQVLKEMYSRSISHGKNFAAIGFLFSTTECTIESYRGRSDLFNSTLSGFTVGGLLGFRAGLQAAIVGGTGFAMASDASMYKGRLIPDRLMRRTVSELESILAERRKKKLMMKANETPEEKRARRIAKKAIKGRNRRERMGWDKEYLGYTNEDNPFGDHKLSESFVWTKKLEKVGLCNLSNDDLSYLQRQKMESNKLELEAVRRRRLEREREKEQREQDQEMMQREREAEYYRTWGQQEDNFHLEQAKLRSRIRIADGRAQPIDLLSKYIADQEEKEGAQPEDILNEDMSLDLLEPTQFLVGLDIEDLEDLIEDIKVVYMDLEKGANADFWRDVSTVVKDELKRMRLKKTGSMGLPQGAESITPSVMESIEKTLDGKTHAQLKALEKQIEPKLKGGEGVDVGYWEALYHYVLAQMARTRLRERHEENLRNKLERLREAQGILNAAEPANQEKLLNHSPEAKVEQCEEEVPEFVKPGPSEEKKLRKDRVERDEYDAALYSPLTVDPQDLELDAVVYDLEDDIEKLNYLRIEVRNHGTVTTGTSRAEDELVRRAKEGMEDGEEAQFSVQMPVEEQSFLWSDKYRPRKPRFFNRVHTGFVWNKYNQTHYDLDNPPPKIVQGYKFNIFYPDLIDKSQTPTYSLTPLEGDERDFAILRFSAGPPYEDIAFKVVNREWEYSYRHGFRCQFQNNIFQLWFHFKRFRYRR
ncbi:hypothetical protein Ciccas_004229 [Cichlidogyrus casuarinus]|uniref:Splicing factor Cactin n=1 Tax=Cichlidogyrus casuarinus TaxID=1844966 RepID=A0ABD2QD22_9PLAT